MTDSLIERFSGYDGKRRLIAAIQLQQFVSADEVIARRIADVASLRSFSSGAVLATQDGCDNDLFLIVDGDLSIQVNGREVAVRHSGQHVGEMVVVDASARRSATVVAMRDSLIATVSEAAFSQIAQEHPILWRRLATELAARLRQRNQFVDSRRTRPVVFIGSSTEALTVAEQIRTDLQRAKDADVRLWTDGVFRASHFAIEALEQQVRSSDFAVLVAVSDDKVISRGVERGAPRDNVIFELGLFMGALGRFRCFIVSPSRVDLKIPTDLLGLTVLKYDQDSAKGTLAVRLAPVSAAIQTTIRELGAR